MSDLGGLFSGSRPRLGGGRVRRIAAQFDWPLVLAILALAAVGLANLFSATYNSPHSGKFDQQLVWVGIGLVLFVALSLTDYQSWHRFAWVGLFVVILLILYVRLFTDPIKGSQRWLSLGGFARLQPSELAKIAVILALARVLHDKAAAELSPRQLVVTLVGLVVPVALVAWQPDLGTAILIGLIMLSVALLLIRDLRGVVARYWGVKLVSGGGVIVGLRFLWRRLEDYQQGRIMCFLDPSIDPTGRCYHILQSLNAVGSGRMTGKGYLNATQSRLKFLPEHWTDFPFSVWAEEWGFVGSVGLIALFGFLILWIVRVAAQAKDLFGTAICLGVAAMLFWHVVINIAMVLSLAPVVGVTLPLVSYGGSSVITFFVALGLVGSVSSRSQT